MSATNHDNRKSFNELIGLFCPPAPRGRFIKLLKEGIDAGDIDFFVDEKRTSWPESKNAAIADEAIYRQALRNWQRSQPKTRYHPFTREHLDENGHRSERAPAPTKPQEQTIETLLANPTVRFDEEQVRKLLGTSDVAKANATVEPVSIADLTSNQSESLTAAAESACRRNLLALMTESLDRAPLADDELFRKMREKNPKLSRRAFDRAKKEAIKQSGARWNAPGPKSAR